MPLWQKSNFLGSGRGGRPGRKEMRESIVSAETERRRPGRGKRKVYNRAAGIEILNYGITRLGNWRGAGGMRQRHGAENPGGDTARKIRTAIRRGKSGRRCCLKPEKGRKRS